MKHSREELLMRVADREVIEVLADVMVIKAGPVPEIASGPSSSHWSY